MAEAWFQLSRQDQSEALEVAAARLGRPAHLLEKDIWLVWALSAIYDSPLNKKLTFKGGTSLSKVYRIIERFSEDVDLTYDIRELVPDLLKEGNPIPTSGSQERRISREVRKRLPIWIKAQVIPILQAALEKFNLNAALEISGRENEKLLINYPVIKTGTGYAAPSILLEFGARATGEPHQAYSVVSDIASIIAGVQFPTARPIVMSAERTFWEKATAIHVYCLQGRLRGERYSRHWYDLVALSRSEFFTSAMKDLPLARQVAEHKSVFFSENDSQGNKINYVEAIAGKLQLVPTGASLDALERDYSAMLSDGLLPSGQPDFTNIIRHCRDIEFRVNSSLR